MGRGNSRPFSYSAAGGTLLTPLTLGQPPPLPAMTDDRHADALGVTRRGRRREYQGTGGRDEEAPAPEGAEAPRRHEDGKPCIRGEDTACFNPRQPPERTAGAMQAQAPTAQSIDATG